MSQKRCRVPKVSLAMLKGRSAAVSVPSIRFNPGEEDLEVQEDCDNDGITLSKSSVEFEQKAVTDHRRILTSSSSADGTKELSPTKENPLKFSKRSSSLDSGTYGDGGGKDAWSLFYEIKGKITKTVEETLHIDLRSSDAISSQQLSYDDSKLDENNSPETEVVEEAINALGLETNEELCPDTKPSSLKTCSLTSSSNASSSVNKFHAISSDLTHRRKRFLSKADTPAMSMSSLMATKANDDDILEEQLHEEYIKDEVHLEDVVHFEEKVHKDVTEICSEPKMCPDDTKTFISTNLKSSMATIDTKWLLCCGFVILFYVIPIPSFFVGFVLGVIVAGYVVRLYYQLASPNIRAAVPTVFKSSATFQLPVITNKTATVYRGWMNDLKQPYNPLEYHVSHTQSVFVRLEGSMLRISHTKSKIPKHASFSEPRHDASFYYQRYYDLAGCQVSLLPDGLAKKRFWSRKYPICISLCEGACKTSHVSSVSSISLDGERGNGNSIEEHTVVDSYEKQLFLFTRTCREKEEWYWRFFKATMATDKIKETRSAPSSPKHVTDEDEYSVAVVTHTQSEFCNRLQQTATNSISVPDVTQLVSDNESSQISFEASVLSFFTPEYVLKFENYMKRLMNPKEYLVHNGESAKKTPLINVSSASGRHSSDDGSVPDMMWLNTFLSRSFWDFLEEPYWTTLVQNKIQKKLSKIRLPQFIDELRITDLDFGNQLPVVENISPPEMNEQGLWIYLDITYNGIFRMTLETKANLLKLKKEESVEMSSPDEQRMRSAIFNDEVEDSAESSTDDEGVADFPEAATEEGAAVPAATGASKKIIRIVDKITQSRYFQHATEFKYVRRAVEEVSNTRLILTVEVHSIAGTVALNIPPPPTDRLWYGFRTDPQVVLLAKPKLGEREVTVYKLAEWIEKKLIQEFQKVFVMPNMDDIPIPFMSGLSPFPSRRSAQIDENSSALLL